MELVENVERNHAWRESMKSRLYARREELHQNANRKLGDLSIDDLSGD